MEAFIKCSCGLVQGSAGPLSKNLNRRITCMCKDCQAFAHYLDRVDLMLDPQGGTEIIPIHPSMIHFTQGTELLACVRLSDDGLRRWYTTCCKTPVANTHPKNRLPFAGVHRSILVFPEQNMLGEVLGRINGPGSYGTIWATLSALRFLAFGFLRGLHVPWPFPKVAPKIGTDAEYFDLIAKTLPR